MAVSRLNGLLLWQVQGNENSRCLSLARKNCDSFLDRSSMYANSSAGEPDIPVQLPYVNLFDASHNKVSRLKGLLDIVPSAWWINLRNNKLKDSKNLHPLPMAMGSLDLCGNPVSTDVLHTLAASHILRLHMFPNDTINQQKNTLGLLPKFNNEVYLL